MRTFSQLPTINSQLLPNRIVYGTLIAVGMILVIALSMFLPG